MFRGAKRDGLVERLEELGLDPFRSRVLAGMAYPFSAGEWRQSPQELRDRVSELGIDGSLTGSNAEAWRRQPALLVGELLKGKRTVEAARAWLDDHHRRPLVEPEDEQGAQEAAAPNAPLGADGPSEAPDQRYAHVQDAFVRELAMRVHRLEVEVRMFRETASS